MSGSTHNNLGIIILTKNIFPISSLVLIVATVTVPLLSFFLFFDFNSIIENYQSYYLKIISFSILQALVSSMISVFLGILLAHLLFKHRYLPGIRQIVHFLAFTFILPTIIIVLGAVSVYGKAGYFNGLFEVFNLNIYGLLGIVIAHVLLNFPFVARAIFQSLSDVSNNEWSLAKHNGISGFALFKTIEWPAIKRTVPSVLIIVFILCFMSFAPVIIFGGGPNFSTLEVSIYQALLYEYDFNKAINLALIQIIICIFFIYFFLRLNKVRFFSLSDNKLSSSISYSFKYSLDYLLLLCLIIFAFSPLIIILVKGIQSGELANTFYSSSFVTALVNTFIISLFSGILSITLSIGLLYFGKNIFKLNSLRKFYFFETQIYLLMVFSPVLISSGFFILFRNFLGMIEPGLWIVIIINSVFTIPLSYSLIKPSFYKVFFEQNFLIKSLSINGFKRFILIEWPAVKSSIITAFIVTSIVSSSDLVIISFFGTNDFSTLSLLIFRLMGSYQIAESHAVSLFFLIYCFIYFIISYKLLSNLNLRIS